MRAEPAERVKNVRAEPSAPVVALVKIEAIREVVAVLPEAFCTEKRIPAPIPEAATPLDPRPIEKISRILFVELSLTTAESADTPASDVVVAT